MDTALVENQRTLNEDQRGKTKTLLHSQLKALLKKTVFVEKRRVTSKFDANLSLRSEAQGEFFCLTSCALL